MFYKVLGGEYNLSSNNDIYLIIIISIIYSFFNLYYFKYNSFINFICYYNYYINFLTPFVFIIFFEETIFKIVNKYQFLEYGFFKTFLSVATFSFFANYIFSKIKSQKNVTENLNRRINLNFIRWIFFFLIANILFTSLQLPFYNYFYGFFNPQLHLLFFIYIYMVSDSKNNLKSYLIPFLIIYVTYTVITGSRGGLFHVLLYSLLVLLYVKGDFILSFKRYFSISIFLFIGLLTYPIATIFRIINNSSDFSFDILFDAYSVTNNHFIFMLSAIVERLSMLNYSFTLSNDLYNPFFFKQYFTFNEFFNSSINLTFPLDYNSNSIPSNSYLRSLVDDSSYFDLKYDWSSFNAYIVDFNHLYNSSFSFIISIITILIYSLICKLFNRKSLLLQLIYVFLILNIINFFVFFGYDYMFKHIVHSIFGILLLWSIFLLSNFNNKKNKL
tara:strand:- start:757 stop:2085 length:1329 start_codon:yes stop_codon:yes gene_type:complete